MAIESARKATDEPKEAKWSEHPAPEAAKKPKKRATATAKRQTISAPKKDVGHFLVPSLRLGKPGSSGDAPE